MNLLLFRENELSSDGVILINDSRVEHLLKILKVRLNSSIKVGQVGGEIGLAQVVAIGSQGVSLQIESLDMPSVDANVTMLLAMPRPQMLKRVLELIPQFGVSELHLVSSKKVEKSYFSSPLLKEENYSPYLIRGMQQAMVTTEPKVFIWKSFYDFQKSSGAVVAEDELGIIAEVGGNETLLSLKNQILNVNKVRFAVGPEGGWTDDEIVFFQSKGFSLVNLGKRVLRVDMAVCSLLAQQDLLRSSEL